MIKIENLKKFYGKTCVIDDVSLEVKQGEIFAIVGHSGAGKSTLLRCINGLEDYQEGSLKVEGREVRELSAAQIRELRKNIGMIFQHFALMSRRSVAQNVATPLEFWGYSKDHTKRRVAELLELVGLADKANAYPSELSGGQRQRVYIARALCAKAKILLLDEPLASIDTMGQVQIYELLKSLNESGCGIILISHDVQLALNYANRALYVANGSAHTHEIDPGGRAEFLDHLRREHGHFCAVDLALNECCCKEGKNG